MKPTLNRILLAEDNPHDLELTLEGLRSHGVINDVVVVRDGAQVLDYLYRRGDYADREPTTPGVILLDLKMPKVDGLEVLRAVKSDAALRAIPIVVLTSSREESDLVRSYDLGVNAYVVKPMIFTDFVTAVKSIGGFWAVLNEVPTTRTNG